jgi:hypothetical protein
MKKIISIACVAIIVFGTSCSSTKVAVSENTGATINSKIFYHNFITRVNAPDAYISKGTYLNSEEISMSAVTATTTFDVKNGVWIVSDSTHNKLRKIPAKTQGKIVEIIRNPAKEWVDHFRVSFDTKDGVFILLFTRAGDGSFILNNDASITYNGEPYNVTVPSGAICQLLFFYENNSSSINDVKIAEGNPPGSKPPTQGNQNQNPTNPTQQPAPSTDQGGAPAVTPVKKN